MLQEADIGVGISGAEGMQVIFWCFVDFINCAHDFFSYSCFWLRLSRLSWQVMLPLPNSAFWNGYFWCMDIGVTGASQWWYSCHLCLSWYILIMICNSGLLITLWGVNVQICYFFYKNVTFGVTIFLYEAFSSFSGKPAYNDWFLSLYNVFFTSLPVIALGVFDQDVSARLCIQVI